MFKRNRPQGRTVSFDVPDGKEINDGLTHFVRSWVYEKAAKLIQGAQEDADYGVMGQNDGCGKAGLVVGTFQGKPCYYLAVAEHEPDGSGKLAVEPLALILLPEHFESGMVGGPGGVTPTRCNPDGTPVVTH